MANIIIGRTHDSGLRSQSATSSALSWAGGTLTVDAGDTTIGDIESGGSWYSYVGYLTFDLSDIPETATTSDVDLVLNIDANNTGGNAFDIEVYLLDYTTPPVSGDWPTSAELVTLEGAGGLLASVTAPTVNGDITVPGTAYFSSYVNTLLAAGTQELKVMVVSSRHRLGSTIDLTDSRIDYEDAAGTSEAELSVTYSLVDTTGHDSVTINATNSGNDGRLRSQDAVHSTALAGPADNISNTGGALGQQVATNYNVYHQYMEFALSTIPAGVTITDVVFDPYVDNDQSTATWEAEVFEHDWGAAIGMTAADWLTPAELNTLFDSGERLARFLTTAVGSDNRYTFTDDGFVRKLQAAIDAEDTNFQIAIASSRVRSSSTPTGNEYIGLQLAGDAGANPPRITVYYKTIQLANTAILGAAF